VSNSALPSNPDVSKAYRVHSIFNRIAGRYDLLNDCISFGLHRFWKQKAVDCLKLNPGQYALDVCTGTGDLIHYLEKRVGPTGKLTGLDFSEEMLAIARNRYQDKKRIHFEQGDAQDLPFGEDHFDGAVVAFGLRNVTDIDKTLQEMMRVVKPGARVVNLDTSPKPRLPGFKLYFRYVMPLIGQLLSGDRDAYEYLHRSTEDFLSPEALKERFEATGFQNVQIVPVAFESAVILVGTKPGSSS
jgi:demethylmenaquinone methyltransferase/2-methoxy-6-polyprenyl-1,4-benzoquinol methylase